VSDLIWGVARSYIVFKLWLESFTSPGKSILVLGELVSERLYEIRRILKLRSQLGNNICEHFTLGYASNVLILLGVMRIRSGIRATTIATGIPFRFFYWHEHIVTTEDASYSSTGTPVRGIGGNDIQRTCR
jgi:hypothetical protein